MFAAAVLIGVWVPGVWAGSYDVPACDAAPGAVNNSWTPWSNMPEAVTAYVQCPSGGDPNRGIIARAVHTTGGVSTGVVARAMFAAPAGTVIVGLRASYTFSRTSSRWEAALSNGSQLLRGCLGGGADSCAASAVDEWIDVPASAAIYIDALCTHGTCQLESTPVAVARIYSATVRIQDDESPFVGSPSGGLWGDGWMRGTQSVSFDASDNTGIQHSTVYVDGQFAVQSAHACDYTFTTPCPNGGADLAVRTIGWPDGPHDLTVQTTDAAGNTSQISRRVLIDNTPPGPPQHLSVDGGEGWRSGNDATVRWTNPPADGNAPITGALWRACPASGTQGCVNGSADGREITSVSGISMPTAGDWTLSVWLRDGAGNADERTAGPPVHIRYDNEPPSSAAFDPIDPADPARAVVSGSDAMSGIGAGRMEIKRDTASAWRPLSSQVDEAGRLVTVLPDERLKDGTYDLRATVADQAGNERSTSTRADGTVAQVTLPVRSPTRLSAGRPASRARTARLRTRVNLRYGGRVRLSGRLADAERNAMGGTSLTVLERTTLAGAQWRTVSTIHTSNTGRFSYRTRRGPNRKVRIRYEGTPTVRAANADVALRVAASTSIDVDPHRLRNGQRARFSGRVSGRVRSGKLIQLQTLVHGHWQTFTTTRVREHGRWARSYRFIGTHGRAVYRFRARVPSEHGFAYRTGNSKTIRLHVRGP